MQGLKKTNFRPVKPQIYYRNEGGQRIKIVPKRSDLPCIQLFDDAASSSMSSEQTVPVSVSRRKSQHIVKEGDIEEVQFETADETKEEDEDNKLIMKNLAWLRVSLNYLLEELGMDLIEFHGRPGKTKIVEKVKAALESRRVKIEKIDEGPEMIMSPPTNMNMPITTTSKTNK